MEKKPEEGVVLWLCFGGETCMQNHNFSGGLVP